MITLPVESYSWGTKKSEVRVYAHEEGERLVTLHVNIEDQELDGAWDMEPEQARALAAMLIHTADAVERPR